MNTLPAVEIHAAGRGDLLCLLNMFRRHVVVSGLTEGVKTRRRHVMVGGGVWKKAWRRLIFKVLHFLIAVIMAQKSSTGGDGGGASVAVKVKASVAAPAVPRPPWTCFAFGPFVPPQSETGFICCAAALEPRRPLQHSRRGAIASGPLKLNQRWHCPYFRRVMCIFIYSASEGSSPHPPPPPSPHNYVFAFKERMRARQGFFCSLSSCSEPPYVPTTPQPPATHPRLPPPSLGRQ